MRYKIVKSSYYDEYGREKSTQYYILRRKRFLGIQWWSRVVHSSYESWDTTWFNTESEAKRFVEEVLEKGRPYDRWNDVVVNGI